MSKKKQKQQDRNGEPRERITVDDEARNDDGHDVAVKSGGQQERGPDGLKVPAELPVLPVRDTVAFPGTVMPLAVSREKSKFVLDRALAGARMIAVVAQRHSQTEDPNLDDLFRVGTACTLLKLFKMPDGNETAIVHGLARVGIESIKNEKTHLIARVHARPDVEEESTELAAIAHNVRHSARRIIELSPNVSDEAKTVLDELKANALLADYLASNLPLSLVHKQELLETFDVGARLRKIHAAVAGQLEVLELSQKLHNQVRSQVDKNQREYFLREQLKAIQQELGQKDARSTVIDKLRERIAAAKMPEAVEADALREVERMENIPQASPEYSTTMDYVEWLCDLPWSVSTTDTLDINQAERILNQDHYGLHKVKKRILEFLAVRQLKPDGRGPILCFAGPPGVGKTSLGQSIARALGRRFIRIALGGAHDESDIRGHRRTYIGALPGRIIQELRKAGANNPVFMLDEVDKLGKDFRGDPSSALLEVLDPAQNDTFTDRYLDVPFDLSKVMFIATANYMDAVPAPLRDRMEVITLSGYTLREKLQIAKRYLAPRQLERNGLQAKQLSFDDDALTAVIAGYTREAGVRELERKIAAVCRSRAAAIVRGRKRSNRVTRRSLQTDLGVPVFDLEVASRLRVPGVVTGLAFTAVGGEILFVEATRMPGNGQLTLTGQMGSVMRESAQAAYSIVRSRAKRLKIDPQTIKTYDYHIHVPAGAVPKDGPSAGVAMVTVLVSLMSDRAVDPNTGMTGEITLRGAVLPIGGVRAKVLAAHRAGLDRVILPARNEKDLEEIVPEVRKALDFEFVSTIDQLLKTVLPNGAAASGRAKPASGPQRAGSRKRRRSAATTGKKKARAGSGVRLAARSRSR